MTRLRHGLLRAVRAGAVILLALSASAAPASATSAAPATTSSGPTVTKSIDNDTSRALRQQLEEVLVTEASAGEPAEAVRAESPGQARA